MSQSFFQEKQAIPSVWRVVLFGGVTLMMGFIFLMTYLTEWETMPQQERWSMFTLLIAPLAVSFIFFIRIDLRITETFLEYKVAPFGRKYRKILFSDIAEIKIEKAKTIRSFRGVGINHNINRIEYNFGSKHILEVKLKKGKYIVFSTFKPKELEYFLRNLPEEAPVVRENTDY
ncbi:MAG: hypothetical protein V2A67_11475 [Bacteroidota bacterium]